MDDPVTTQERFQASLLDSRSGCSSDGYLRTGDLGFLWEGEVFVTGRLKDLIILNGRNLHPQDLEETVAKASTSIRKGRVAAFAVSVFDAEQAVNEGLAVVLEINERHPTADALDALVSDVRAALLTTHQASCQALIVARPGSIKKTTSGKLRRQAIRQAYIDSEFCSHRLSNRCARIY